MPPKLSVLMPAYNRAHWLPGALASVLAPGLDLELIVVDNGSQDGTWALLEAWSQQDPRLRIVRWDTNDGAEVFPALLEMATGQYVNFFADDDEMLPGGLARKMDILDRHPATGMVFSTVQCMDAQGQDLGEGAWTVIEQEDFLDREDLFASLILGNFVPMPAAMFRRSLAPTGEILRDGSYLSSRDWPFWLDLVQRTRVAYLRKPTLRLRLHGGQETMKEGIVNGTFQRTNLRVWRHWMVEVQPPFIPSSHAWGVMTRAMYGALQATHGQDMTKIQEGLGVLQALRDEQDTMLARALDAQEEPFPEAFLFEPEWDGQDWQERVRAFARAFTPADPVVLALLLDPERPGTPAPGEAQAALEAALAPVPGPRPAVRLLEPSQFFATLRDFPHCQWLPSGGPPPVLEGTKGRRLATAVVNGAVRP